MQQSVERTGFAILFSLLVLSCTLLDVTIVHDSRIMMKWFGCCAISLAMAASLFLWSKQRYTCIRIADLAIVAFLLYILFTDLYRGDFSEPIAVRITSLGLLYVVFRQPIGKSAINVCFVILLAVCFIVAVWGIVQFVLAAIREQSLQMVVVGSFDNPAGLAVTLAFALPIGFHLLSLPDLPRSQRASLYVSLCVIILAILLSGSRTGWLSLLCSGMYTYAVHNRSKGVNIVLLSLGIVLLLVVFYFIRQDSADGRSYVALCTWQQIADAPLWGHGCYGFTSGYMGYQADYLTTHPDSRFSWLADNVRHPFNEWLYLMVRYGIVGLIVLTGVLLSVIPTIKRELSAKHVLPVGLIVALFPFTFFSYPMQYPLAWVMLALIVGILARDTKSVCQIHFHWVIPLLALLAAGTATPLLYRTLRIEMEWYDVATRSLSGQTRNVMPRYEELYRDMKHSPHFLYNYAAELNHIGEYHHSQQILDECMLKMDDYETRLLAASNHERMGNYGLAEQHYRKASGMCPIRFVPLYRLAKLYGMMERYSEQRDIAQQIIGKKEKVPSRRITEMKDEMRYILEERDY